MRKNKIAFLLVASMSVAFASAQTSAPVTGDTAAATTAPTTVAAPATGDAAPKAQPATDELDELNLDDLGADTTGTASDSTEMKWGFASGDVVSVKDVQPDSITLDVPAIKDGAGKEIKRFKVVFSTKSIADTEPTALQQQTFEFDVVTGTSLSLQVTGLNTTNTYFFVVEPMNKDNSTGKASEEVEFAPTHGAAETGTNQTWAAQTQINDFTYAYSGMEVTLKWSPVEWATKVEVYFKTEDQEEYTKVGDAKMTDGSYNFALTKTGNAYVKLIPTDDNGAPVGPEIVKSLKIETTVAPEVKKVPKVGPAEDMMIAALIVAALGYGVYRFRRTA